MLTRFTVRLALTACVAAMAAASASAQTAGGTGGGAGGAASAAASRAGAATGAGAGGATSASGPFQGTVAAGFSGGLGTSAQAATGTGAGASGSTAVPTTYNPWRATYGNYYSIGQTILGSTGSKTSTPAANKAFGQPLFTTATTGTGTTTGLSTSTNTAGGFSETAVNRTPRYSSGLSEDVPLVVHSPQLMQANLQATIARSTRLKNPGRIRVVVDGDTVVLLGEVNSPQERRLAESMLALTPGVGQIDNRLVIPGQP